jgi:hypothetical protein
MHFYPLYLKYFSISSIIYLCQQQFKHIILFTSEQPGATKHSLRAIHVYATTLQLPLCLSIEDETKTQNLVHTVQLVASNKFIANLIRLNSFGNKLNKYLLS